MHISTDIALEKLRSSKEVFIELFNHGTLNLEIYKPLIKDYQAPHDRDEIYIIISGSSTFINGQITSIVGQGDFLFVPSGRPHRFIDFTEDFSTWVIFYGPKGGEAKVSV